MTRMIGWNEERQASTGRPCGVHPLASVGNPPEHRGWLVGDEYLMPDIHPEALIVAFCNIDGGMPYMQTTTIGARTMLMSGCHIGHNAVIGEDCEFGAHTVICGEVVVGNGVRLGGLTWVKPKLTIGDGAILGGASVVTKDVPAHEVWCGNPARFLKLANTHPQMRGLEGRKRAAAQYAMTEEEWEAAEARVKFPSREETMVHLYGPGAEVLARGSNG